MWRGFRLSLVLKLDNTLHAPFFFHFTLSCLFLPSSIISTLKYKLSFSSLNSTHLSVVQSLVYFSCSSLSFMFPASGFCFIPGVDTARTKIQTTDKFKEKRTNSQKKQADPQQHKVCSSKVFGHLVLPEQLRCALALIPQVSGTSI